MNPATDSSLRNTPGRLLAGFALVVVVGHHIGTIFGPLGNVGTSTEWADWIDLLVPYAVVGSALLCLHAARAPRTAWLLAAVGTILYVQGHGIHLAANSIGNAQGSAQPVHLWDEVMGHYLWYGGLYLLIASLACALLGHELTSAWRWPLALLFGLTLATNGIEGGTPYFTLAVALGLCGWAWRDRHHAGLVLLSASGVTAMALLGWGIYWQGFPQFSELGWI